MKSWTTEFKVGLFVIITVAIIIASWMWSIDGVRADEASYTLRMSVAAADGLYKGSAVRIAGVDVGSVDDIRIAGDRAEVIIRVRDSYKLPTDSQGELKSQGLLGDYFIRVYPGVGDELLDDGDLLATRSDPGDIDQITRDLQAISGDIKAITAVLRQVVENRENTDHIEATLANVDELSDELNQIAQQNSGDIRAIVTQVRSLSDALNHYVDRIGGGVDLEVSKLQDVTDNVDEEVDLLKELTGNLNDAAEDLESITGKVDRGEGTVGALINDRDTVDRLNEAMDSLNSVVGGIAGIRPEVYYTGRFYMGSQPKDTETFFYGNPLAWSASNTVGMRLKTHEDFWYVFEINDYPQGAISQTEILRENTGTVESRWRRDAAYRFTFQIEKRWGKFSFRIGVKENGGGVGATAYAWKERFQAQLDVFDFFFGSYPSLKDRGIPNVRLLARIEPVRNLYFEAGAEQLILGPKNGFFTGFVGVGFHFHDDDIKWILQGLPLSF